MTAAQYGIGVPPGKVAKTPEEAEAVAKQLSTIHVVWVQELY
jgi:succinyl-CoA synthetase beta subunit